MKRSIMISVMLCSMMLFVAASAVLVFGVLPAAAGKRADVIAKSNGFPSGQHFNLNIHGKDWGTCNAVQEGDLSWGNSIFIPEYGGATLQYVSNKKASLTELTVRDPCSGFDGERDVAKIQLPYKVLVEDVPTPAEGFYVFGRIHGKPNNGDTEPVSSIILYPNVVMEACNDSGLDPTDPDDPPFGNYTDCDGELALGVIVGNNLYIPDPDTEVYKRFDPVATKGKGKSKATDITRLFTYTGWVVDETLDTAEPFGEIDINDVPLDDYDGDGSAVTPTPDNHDFDNDGDEDPDDVTAWLTAQSLLDPPMAWDIDAEWILNIADLVITEQGLVNDGTKLLQIRFYPVATTTFE